LIAELERGLTIFLGLLCFLAFLANAILLAYVLYKRGGQNIARCPRCGRPIVCPHCDEEDGGAPF
jgi:hypothetical protein